MPKQSNAGIGEEKWNVSLETENLSGKLADELPR
jgi:hypothetical protein